MLTSSRIALAGAIVALVVPAGTASAWRGPAPKPPTAAHVQGAAAKVAAHGPSRERGGSAAKASPSGPFPENRIVALYGISGSSGTILGRDSVAQAKRDLRDQAAAYAGFGRPVIPAFDYVAVVATQCPGDDGLCRTRIPNATIRRYHSAIADLGGRLILDIQPGRSTFLDEVKALGRWLRRPDVDVALDPEWNVGPNGVPGRDAGSVDATTLNHVSRYLQHLVGANSLPPKVMIVHQFSKAMIQGRGQIVERPDVEVTLDFDGIGTPAEKTQGYEALSVASLFNGIMLFYTQPAESPLMTPSQVVGLTPEPDFVGYQ